MKRKSIVIFLITLILLTFKIYSKESSVYRIDLNDGWSYSTDVSSVFYTPISNNSFSQFSNLVPDHSGYIYLKKSFTIPSAYRNLQLGLYIGQIKIAAEVYVNGNLLGTSGIMPPHEFYNGEKPAVFYIPSDIINYGNPVNEIQIKLYVNSYGKISQEPFIDLWPNVLMAQKKNNLFSSELPYCFSIFLCLISLLYLFFYFIRPTDKSNLSFSLLTLFSSLYLFTITWGEYPVTPLTSFLTYEKIFNGIAPYATMFCAISFILDYLEKKENTKFKSFRIAVLGICCIVPFFAQTMWQFYVLQVIGYFFSGFMFLYPVIIIFEDIYKQNKKVIPLLTGFTPVLVSLVIAFILIFTINFQYTRFVIIFGWLFTIMIFLSLLLVNYVKLFARVEFVNTNLEKIVKSKTKQLQEANSSLEETNYHLKFEKDKTLKELQLASYVQQNFYKIHNTNFSDWETGIFFKPLESVSGDLYDLYTQNNQLKGAGIFDVSGHGISSGLVTMLVKNIIQQEFNDGLNEDLTQVLYKINKRVINEKGSIENYLTGIICRITKDELEYVSAGHPEPFFIHNNQTEVLSKISESQGVIGIPEVPTNFISSKIKMNKGDTLVLYTDGFTEAANEYSQLYGKQRMLESIDKHKDLAVQEMADAIKDDLMEYTKYSEIKDDITLLILRRK